MIFSYGLANAGRGFQGWFCEQNIAAASELEERLVSQGPPISERTRVLCQDHRMAVREIAAQLRQLPGHKFGLIYADPNGSEPEEEVASIEVLIREFPKLDVLMYVSAATIKRCLGVKKLPAFKGKLSLLDYLERLEKRHVLVREPCGANQWTFLLATNMESRKSIAKIGLYATKTDRGREIIDQLVSTTADLEKREKKGQQAFKW